MFIKAYYVGRWITHKGLGELGDDLKLAGVIREYLEAKFFIILRNDEKYETDSSSYD